MLLYLLGLQFFLVLGLQAQAFNFRLRVQVTALCTYVLNANVKDVIVRDVIVIDGTVRHGIAGGGDFISLKLHAILTFPLIMKSP